MVRNDLRNVAIIAHVDHGKTTWWTQMLRRAACSAKIRRWSSASWTPAISSVSAASPFWPRTPPHLQGRQDQHRRYPGPRRLRRRGRARAEDGQRRSSCWWTPPRAPCPRPVSCCRRLWSWATAPWWWPSTRSTVPMPRIKEVIDEVLYLLMDLGATDEQLDCPMLFCCGRDGTASLFPGCARHRPEAPVRHPAEHITRPKATRRRPSRCWSPPSTTTTSWAASASAASSAACQGGRGSRRLRLAQPEPPEDARPSDQAVRLPGQRPSARNITAGDIVAFSGLPDVTIGNTLCAPECVEPLPFVKINDPTVEMTFSVNDSPLAGREGKFVTSRQIRDRLPKELLKDVPPNVEDSRHHRFLPRHGPRRDAPVHPDRDHAPRGL